MQPKSITVSGGYTDSGMLLVDAPTIGSGSSTLGMGVVEVIELIELGFTGSELLDPGLSGAGLIVPGFCKVGLFAPGLCGVGLCAP